MIVLIEVVTSLTSDNMTLRKQKAPVLVIIICFLFFAPYCSRLLLTSWWLRGLNEPWQGRRSVIVVNIFNFYLGCCPMHVAFHRKFGTIGKSLSASSISGISKKKRRTIKRGHQGSPFLSTGCRRPPAECLDSYSLYSVDDW